MKKLLLVVGIAALLSSCAMAPSPLMGGLFTKVQAPLAVTSNQGSVKVGTAEATSILGIIATGDASINAAAKSAGITKIHHVDYEGFGVLGIFAKYTVYVYGE
jgi:hypothetical protein